MSVEAHVIAAVVSEGVGGLRKCYQAGIGAEDFVSNEEEFAWIEDRVQRKQPFGLRLFRQKFPEFEMLQTDERLQDLLVSLKNETAFSQTRSLIESLSTELEVENAVDKAMAARDILGEITRQFAPVHDHALIGGWRDHYDEQRRIRRLRQAGEPPGIPTGFQWIDFHWDGLVNGRMIIVLGRPGEGKTYLVEAFGANAVLDKRRIVMFSPEMNRREHTCRIHTLLSAMPEVKKACGLEHSFRNRALMRGIGYPEKPYKRFMEWLEGCGGEIILLTNTHRQGRMTPAYMEAKIADLGPDMVLVDPIYDLAATRPRDSRIAELSDISDAIAGMCEQFNIPIVATNQAHRQMSGKDDAPHKDTSFNSDVPIQRGDHVIGVKNISDERRMIVRCSKSRFGHDFRFELKFHPNTGVMLETTKPTGSYTNGKDDDFEDDELAEIVASATRAPQKRGKAKVT